MSPGDLCVVVDHPQWRASEDWRMIKVRDLIGKTCVLVAGPIMVVDSGHNLAWSPFWKISGLALPAFFTLNMISEKVLRKIEPPPQTITSDEEMAA